MRLLTFVKVISCVFILTLVGLGFYMAGSHPFPDFHDSEKKARLQMHMLAEVIKAYKHECGKWPNSLANLTAEQCPSFSQGNNYAGLADPWGRLYLISHSERVLQIKSLGQDGKAGGSKGDGDIVVEVEK